MQHSVQWNPDKLAVTERKPHEKMSYPITEHPLIRHGSYDELMRMIGADKYEKEYKHWSTLGIVYTPYGLLIIQPGQWLNFLDEKNYFITPEDPYFPAGTDAYKAGFEAGRAGKSMLDNPHVNNHIDQPDADQWHKGLVNGYAARKKTEPA